MAAPESRPVVLLYNRVAKTLVEYEMLWTASWLRSIHAAHTGLDRTLIRRDPETGTHATLIPGLLASSMVQTRLVRLRTIRPEEIFCRSPSRSSVPTYQRSLAGSTVSLPACAHAGKHHVNFQRSLLELIRETRWLGRMGVDIPEIARHLLPQEAKFRDDYDKLTELLTASSI